MEMMRECVLYTELLSCFKHKGKRWWIRSSAAGVSDLGLVRSVRASGFIFCVQWLQFIRDKEELQYSGTSGKSGRLGLEFKCKKQQVHKRTAWLGWTASAWADFCFPLWFPSHKCTLLPRLCQGVTSKTLSCQLNQAAVKTTFVWFSLSLEANKTVLFQVLFQRQISFFFFSYCNIPKPCEISFKCVFAVFWVKRWQIFGVDCPSPSIK